MAELRLVLASDHAGLALKTELLAALGDWGVAAADLGVHEPGPADYPDIADALAHALARSRGDMGVLVCGTGLGIAMAANRHAHIRAAVCHDATSARLARQHNDANVLALGGRLIGAATARDCLKAFIETSFEGGRHRRRVDKLSRAPRLC